jgi:hypothetical protein
MQISIESVEKREDPYQIFIDSIKNKETRRRYKNYLLTFLKLVPDKFYKERGIEISKGQDVSTFAIRKKISLVGYKIRVKNLGEQFQPATSL